MLVPVYLEILKKFRPFEKENEAENARMASFNTLFSYLHFEFAKIKLRKITKLEITVVPLRLRTKKICMAPYF